MNNSESAERVDQSGKFPGTLPIPDVNNDVALFIALANNVSACVIVRGLLRYYC